MKAKLKHIKLRKINLLIIILFVSSFVISAQSNRELAKFESLIRLADKQFELAYYQNAASFYNRALEIKPEDAHVNFFLAECYKNLFQYDKAKDKYKKAAENDIEHYPISLFNYALMLKFEGQYENALNEFHNFIDKTKDVSPANFKDKRTAYQRVLLEMESCYWSLEQLFEYKIYQLPEPLNSKYNDFAPVIFKNDTNILLVSGRLKSKYKAKNDMGEGVTDYFNFSKALEWDETEFENKFSKLNSGFYEGPGVFNADKTIFYFTRCGAEEDGHCKLYSSKLGLNNKWSEPKLLNSFINAPESDNKQPALSASSDTLFFVSNRYGGFGLNDIWYSVLDQETKDWSKPVNIGTEINTPFNEVSPFYFAVDNSLFFASDGHKGFGGTDIFLAKQDNSGNYSIVNLGSPLNSNFDDNYFVLGKSKGYLSSNRSQSIGKFDIFSFDNLFANKKYANYNQKLQELAEEFTTIQYEIIQDKPELPEELVSTDFQEIYDKILSSKYAAMIFDVVMIFNEIDYKTFEALSIDDKSIIDMLYMAEEVNITDSKIDSIQSRTTLLYNSININEKEFIDRIANNYFQTTGGSSFIKMSQSDQDFYKTLKLEDKQRIDLLINYKIKSENEKIIAQNTSSLVKDNFGVEELIEASGSNFTFEEYESLISKKLAGFIHSNNLTYNKLEFDIFNKLSLEDQSLLDMDYKSRAFDLTSENIGSLVSEDEKIFNELDSTTKLLLEGIALKHFIEKNLEFTNLDNQQLNYYQNLNLNEKRKFDRLLAYNYNLLVLDSLASIKKEVTDLIPGIDTSIVNKQKQNDYERLVSSRLAGYVYNLKFPYNESDYLLSNSLSPEDRGLVDALFNVKASEINDKILEAIFRSNKKNYGNLNTQKKNLINSIAKKYSDADISTEFIRLSDQEKQFYQNLNIEEKQNNDNLIAYRYAQILDAKKEEAAKYSDITNNELAINQDSEIGELFESEELEKIQRLLSYKTAMYIYNVSEVFLSPDYFVFENTNQENLSLLDVLYDSKVYSYKDIQVLNAIQEADKNQYKLLNKESREFIERQVELLIFTEDGEQYISIMPQDSTWYSNLNIESKYKIDRLLMYKLNSRLTPVKTALTTEDYLVSDYLYISDLAKTGKIVTKKDYYNYERIVSFMLALKIYDLKFPPLSNDFQIIDTLKIDDLSIIDYIYASKLSALSDSSIVDSLHIMDKDRFANTPIENSNFVNRTVNLYFSLNDESRFIDLEAPDYLFYSNLEIKQKYQLDRFIAMKIKDVLEAEKISSQMNSTLKKDELNIEELSIESDILTSNEIKTYDRLLAFMLANHIYDIKIPFNELDYHLNKSLDIEQLSTLDMMVSIKSYSLEEQNSFENIIAADKTVLENYNSEKLSLVNNIFERYTNSDDSATFIVFNPQIKTKYQNLSKEEKFETDRLVAHKLSVYLKTQKKIKEIEENLINDEFSNSIIEISENSDVVSESDINAYNRILSFKIACFIHDINVGFNQSDYEIYENLSLEDKSTIDMMFDLKTYVLEDTETKEILQTKDESDYNKLNSDEKAFIDSIVASYVNKSTLTDYIKFPPSIDTKYSSLNIENKNKTDRIIASKLRNLMSKSVVSKSEYKKDDFATELNEIVETSDILTQVDMLNYEKILSFRIANFIYSLNLPFIESDKNIVNDFSIEDNSILDMMFSARIYMLDNESIVSFRNSDKLLLNNLGEFEKNFLGNVIAAYKTQQNTSKIILSSDDDNYYKNLNLIEKNRIDRLIASKLSNLGIDFTDKESISTFNFSIQNMLCKTTGISANITNSNNLKVSLFSNDKLIANTFTDKQGFFKFDSLNQGKDYTIKYNKSISDNLVLTDFQINCEPIDDNGVKIVDKKIRDTVFVTEQIRDTVIVKEVQYVKSDSVTITKTEAGSIENIFFKYNSSALTVESKFLLDLIYEYYTTRNNAIILIQGYADNTGTEKHNLYLSNKRAKAVSNYLVSKGAKKEKIIISSYGNQNPVTISKGERFRKFNRRVRIVIID